MEIPPRLRKIVDFIDGATTVADIGCDHGLCGCALLKEGRAQKVISCDISEKSLAKARALALEQGLCAMECRAGDGLSVLRPGEADVIIIAGMGGMQIASILEEGHAAAMSAQRLVLLPHRNEYELRRFLTQNGYEIVDEALAREQSRYYTIICVQPGNAGDVSDFYLYIGGRLLEKKGPLLKGYLKQKIETLRSIARQAEKSSATGAYRLELEKRINEMEDALYGIDDETIK